DVLCLQYAGKLVLLENHRGGVLMPVEQTVGLNTGRGTFKRGICLHAFDANNDGRLDVLIGHDQGATLFMSQADDVLPAGGQRIELPTDCPVFAAGSFDYDNDGYPDIWLMANDTERPLRLFRNEGHGKFKETTDLIHLHNSHLTNIPIVSDRDHTGALDFLLTTRDGLQELVNVGGNKNRWMDER